MFGGKEGGVAVGELTQNILTGWGNSISIYLKDADVTVYYNCREE